VNFLPENRRFYPKRAVASHVLGYVGMDNEGMSGVEYALEDDIRGEPGRQIIWTDARRRRAASRVEKRPLAGRDVYLTIDETLQHIAESSLERAVRESGAKRAMAILMRPETGEILALAAVPFFNPNRYQDYPAGHWRNRAVTDVYEPGSTFKIITAAAALEEGVVSEEERIDCGRGLIQVGSDAIRDHKVFDVLTFREVLHFSSNVGMIRISQRLGKERMENYIHAFGFGESTKVDLPAESRGILRPASQWGPRTLASIAFGQEIGVTPLQMVTAVNAIAASGYLMRPQLLREIRSPDGDVLLRFEPEPVRRVVSRETASRLTEILVDVVRRGTGVRADVAGFTVAGKTGTAQKAAPGGGYSKTDYVASFAGFVPARKPELTALILLDSPTGDHTGARAAAVFADVIEPSLHYLGVSPERGLGATPIVARWPKQAPLSTKPLPERRDWNPVSRNVGRSIPNGLRVPALYGLPARDAVARAIGMRLVPTLVGSGWVVGQEPTVGRFVSPGTRVTLILGPRGATRFDDAVQVVENIGDGERAPGFASSRERVSDRGTVRRADE
jgi:cell division protein FtsI/penicillin-binding protein 2